jgi:hypothetical protein
MQQAIGRQADTSAFIAAMSALLLLLVLALGGLASQLLLLPLLLAAAAAWLLLLLPAMELLNSCLAVLRLLFSLMFWLAAVSNCLAMPAADSWQLSFIS